MRLNRELMLGEVAGGSHLPSLAHLPRFVPSLGLPTGPAGSRGYLGSIHDSPTGLPATFAHVTQAWESQVLGVQLETPMASSWYRQLWAAPADAYPGAPDGHSL